MRIERHTPSVRAAALLAAAAIVVGCVDQSPVPSNGPTVVVHAVLDAATRNQYIVLQTTNGSVSTMVAVSGAVVTLVPPVGPTLTAAELHDSTLVGTDFGEPRVTSVYRIDLGDVVPRLVAGGAYQLHILLPNGLTVDGETTVPNAVPSLTPSAMDTIVRSRDTFSLAWPRVPGSAAYELTVNAPASLYSTFADTSIALPGTAVDGNNVPAFYVGHAQQVMASAVDRNYYDYYRRTTDEFDGAGLITHLHGAVGVFGSIVEVRTLTLVVK